jgi:ArsR family transcriptional regulator
LDKDGIGAFAACRVRHQVEVRFLQERQFGAAGDVCAADCPHHAHPELPEPQPVGMPDDEVLYDLADLFRVFGDSTRIKILYALHDEELCVCDIANRLGISQSAVSHQLRVLKDSKLVRFRRDGKTVYYALDDDHVRSILSLGMEHVEE